MLLNKINMDIRHIALMSTYIYKYLNIIDEGDLKIRSNLRSKQIKDLTTQINFDIIDKMFS